MNTPVLHPTGLVTSALLIDPATKRAAGRCLDRQADDVLALQRTFERVVDGIKRNRQASDYRDRVRQISADCSARLRGIDASRVAIPSPAREVFDSNMVVALRNLRRKLPELDLPQHIETLRSGGQS